MDIYPAGEDPIPGVDGPTLAAGISGHGHKDTRYLADRDAVVAHLLATVEPGDIVITLGAGNVWQVGAALAELLQQKTFDNSSPET
jgi:UDP-N-acetylmuramate--alanine ligase